MYNIRHVNSSDISQVKELYMSHNKLQRGYFVRTEESIEEWVNHGISIVGAFKDSELVSFMTYKMLNKIPIARVGNIYIKQGLRNMYYFTEDHPVPKILDFILEILESNEYYSWIFSRANLPIYKKLESKKHDLLYRCKYGYDIEKDQYRYERYIEEIIPPYCSSKYEGYAKLFDTGRYEKEIIIFKCCLKSEYRKWKNIK